MGFFTDMSENDFMEEPKEVAPIVLKTESESEQDAESNMFEQIEQNVPNLAENEYESDEDIMNEIESEDDVFDLPSKPSIKTDEDVKIEKKNVKKKEDVPILSSSVDTSTIIGASCSVDGNINSSGFCTILGKVTGSVSCTDGVEIAENGSVLNGIDSSKDVYVYGGTSGGVSARNATFMKSKSKGNVVVNEKLIIKKDAVLIGDVQAYEVEIEGAIKGDIDAKGTVYIKKTAIVKGNIKSSHINIEPDAKVAGSVELCYGDSAAIDEDIFS